MENLVYEWVDFSNFFPKSAKIKILENPGNFNQNWGQNWADWYMNGSIFLEKLVFVWVYFQIPQQHVITKTKLEYPPGLHHRQTENNLKMVTLKYILAVTKARRAEVNGRPTTGTIISYHSLTLNKGKVNLVNICMLTFLSFPKQEVQKKKRCWDGNSKRHLLAST